MIRTIFFSLVAAGVAQISLAEDNAPKAPPAHVAARPAFHPQMAHPNMARGNFNQQHIRTINGVQRPVTNFEQRQWQGRTRNYGNRFVPNTANGNRVYTPRVINNGQSANAAAVANAAAQQRNGRQNWQRSAWNNHNGQVAAHAHFDRSRHDRSWWRSHYNRFAVFGGGYYYWNNGFWYPAYGYDPYFDVYSYDAPLYAYQDQDPGQIIANVQGSLQQQGYYDGAVDGTYGPMTRQALLNFQRDNGLPESGQIDEQTLGALGMQ